MVRGFGVALPHTAYRTLGNAKLWVGRRGEQPVKGGLLAVAGEKEALKDATSEIWPPTGWGEPRNDVKDSAGERGYLSMLLFDTRLGGDAEAEHVAAYTSMAILAESCNWSRWCIPSSRVAIPSRGRAGDGNAHCAHTLNSAPEPPVRGASGMFGTGETPVPQCEMMADWRLTSSSGLAHPTR